MKTETRKTKASELEVGESTKGTAGSYDAASVGQVFQILDDVAYDIVKFHRGDLAHDAIQLRALIDEGENFNSLYGVRESGTSFYHYTNTSTEADRAMKNHTLEQSERVYTVAVSKDGFVWRTETMWVK